ncbi:MAG TPA: 4Fe-4S binding protein, partial [Candidatus Binatia bacterium]|nr:4Fe-4S binding protein [Candidatus Binatia bacterium]
DGAQNLATRLTWIIWWPAIIFTFILVGRFWCVMCPFGALNEWTAKWAAPKRMFPKPLRNLWLATFLFVLLTWSDEQLGIIRSPYMTASLIVLLAALAVVTGLFYQRRTFCRYLCPITGLQGLYSMISPVELRARNRSRCQTECHQECYRGGVHGDGCPMLEFPMMMERNTFCNFCFECVKSCAPGNLALKTRAFGRELWSGLRRHDEAYLAVALVGITSVVSAQMLAPWSEGISRIARYLPLDLRVLMRPVTYLALTESVVFFILALAAAPLAVLLAAWCAVKLSGDPERGVMPTFIAASGMFIPIGLAMHLAHNASHLLAEGAGVIPALKRALNEYTPLDFGAPNWQTTALAAPEVIYALQTLLILAGLGLSLAAFERLSLGWQGGRAEGARALIPFAAVALIFTVINLILLNQPMAMRHGM